MNKKHFSVSSANDDENKVNLEHRAKKTKFIADIKKTVMEFEREKQRKLLEHQQSSQSQSTPSKSTSKVSL